MSQSHDDTHAQDTHAAGSSMLESVIKVLLPMLAVAGVVFYLVGAKHLQPGYTEPVISPVAAASAAAQRIQKIGMVSMGDANKPLASGEEVYKNQCAACHTTGTAGAPKFQDAGAWSARIAQGLDTLIASAVKGKNAMGAQAGGTYNEIEVARAVVYLANAGGAKFTEPAVPAPASAASAPDSVTSGTK